MAKKITEELPAEKKITEELPEKKGELSENPSEGPEEVSEPTEGEGAAEESDAQEAAPEDDKEASSQDVDAMESKELRALAKELGLAIVGVKTEALRDNVKAALAAGGAESLNADVVVLFDPSEDKADFPGMIAGMYIYAGERRKVKLSDYNAVAGNPSYKRVD